MQKPSNSKRPVGASISSPQDLKSIISDAEDLVFDLEDLAKGVAALLEDLPLEQGIPVVVLRNLRAAYVVATLLAERAEATSELISDAGLLAGGA